jgi:hypothetical protein
METANERLVCCVPFCRRSMKAGKYSEWICQKHWQPVPLAVKAEQKRAKAAYRRYRTEECWVAAEEAWGRSKAAAIETAAFI